MTKTTSYEISKKLKEAGFDAEADYNFIERNNQEAFLVNNRELSDIELMNETGKFIKSYDLETLINALPYQITTEFKQFYTGEIYEFEEILTIHKSSIDYFHKEDDIDYYRSNYGYYSIFSEVVKTWEGESLADTAGRLLIKLYEAGIVNFNK